MGRYDAATGIEGQFEPGSGRRVLRNKLGIRRKRDADEREFQLLLAAQEKWLKRTTSETTFTVALLRQMHP